jgi:16S rRNA (uracil1498-N3)-methyltransferase
MSRFLVDPKHISGHQVSLKEKETHHIKNVLRFKEGDQVVVFDGAGNEYRCRIEALDKKEATLFILEKFSPSVSTQASVTLAHSITKGERFDWVVEKGAELGMRGIFPFICERVNVKLDAENKIKKEQRWERLAQAAAKQCGRTTVPTVAPILSFEKLLSEFKNYDRVLLAYELENGTDLKSCLREALKKSPKKILAVVGPEGGFTEKEVQQMVAAGACSVSLGENILRTETAAIAMIAMIQYELLS